MKKFALISISFIAVIFGFFSIPFTSVVIFTITLEDQNKKPISKNAAAVFFDKQGNEITKISLKMRESHANSLIWWSHSSHKTSHLRPKDALRTTTASVSANNCTPLTIPVTIHKHYEPLSGAIHGGGAAYNIYTFKKTVQLECEKLSK